jgi:hypothetical protein
VFIYLAGKQYIDRKKLMNSLRNDGKVVFGQDHTSAPFETSVLVSVYSHDMSTLFSAGTLLISSHLTHIYIIGYYLIQLIAIYISEVNKKRQIPSFLRILKKFDV